MGRQEALKTERREKPQGGYVFRGDVDVFRTSIPHSNRHRDKTTRAENKKTWREEREKDEICVREKTRKKPCLVTSVSFCDSCGDRVPLELELKTSNKITA